MVLVCLRHTFFHSVWHWNACLVCFVPSIWLSLLLASLHIYLYVHTWVCMSSSILQSNETMDTQSKPTFVLLGHPLLFDNTLVCPLHMLSMLCLPTFGSLCYVFLACSPISFISFFACLLVCLFVLCMYTHGTRTLGARARLPWCEQKGKDASKKTQAPKRPMFNRLEA